MMNGLLHRVLLVAFAWMCMAPVLYADKEEIEYRVKIKGAKDNAVERAIKHSARTVSMRKRPPSTMGQLHRRIEKDIPVINAILESRGYYDGKVTYTIDTSDSKARVYLMVDQGEQYRFRKVTVEFSGYTDEELTRINSVIRPKKKVVAETVFDEQQRLIDLQKRRGYPFARLAQRKIEVDRANKVVDLTLNFDPGQLSFFGPILVEGLEELPDKFIHRQIPWREGRRYDAQKVRDFESRLLGTGLFGSARIEPKVAANGTNSIPIQVALNERSQRTIRLGVNYSDIGPGVKVFWEHRSIFGGGERFETSALASPIELEWDARLTRSGFLDANQSLVLDLTLTQESPDAYDSDKVKTSAMILRDFTPYIQGGLGTGYNYSRVEQFASDDNFAYVFFPLQVMLDYRNDRLNPVSGYQAYARTVWNEDTRGDDPFLKTYLEGRDYHMLLRRYRLSSAFRVSAGSINGADLETVPADERFYAGGGGSIRGYEYQSVGPKLNGTPIGGDKLMEFSAELRLQPGNRLGYVAFVDGGSVYNELSVGSITDSFRYGAGLGLRWFTTIGPLRADLAYPLNPDDTQQQRLQFYISLGQAF